MHTLFGALVSVLLSIAGVHVDVREMGSPWDHFVACNAQCMSGNCDPGRHVAIEGPLDEEDGGLHGGCMDYPCCFQGPIGECKHPVCGGGLAAQAVEQIHLLAEAVDRRDWDTVAAHLREYPAVLSLNIARGALQVVNACNGEVFANLPVRLHGMARLLEVAGISERNEKKRNRAQL